MFDTTSLSIFVAASWALIIAPGPDVLYVITRGISQGRKAGLFSAMGITLGTLVHTVSATFGLAVLLHTSALAFLIVKYVGAVYLVYLGFKALKDRSRFTLIEPEKSMDYRSIFWQGVLSNVLNPKVALFFLVFLPQFVNPDNGYITLQMMELGLIFSLFGVMFLSVLAIFAGGIGNWLEQRAGVAGILHWLTGVILIGLGLRLAFVQRK